MGVSADLNSESFAEDESGEMIRFEELTADMRHRLSEDIMRSISKTISGISADEISKIRNE